MHKKSVLLLIFLLVIASCGEKKVHNQIEHYLEEAFQIEEEFIEYQEQLLQLEQRDLQLYDEIVQLEESEVSNLQRLIGEAFQVTEQRGAYLEAERKALKQSQKEFENLESLIEQINDEEIQHTLIKLYETMQKRYESYEQVYESYTQSLQLTEMLYGYLDGNRSTDLLLVTLNDLNDCYEQLFKHNDQFNRLTKEYNHLKKEYYELVWE